MSEREIEGPESVFKEWPKWVGERIALDAEHARFILSHKPGCAVHREHPDADQSCDCGGKTPSPKDLAAAGIGAAPTGGEPAPAKAPKAKRPAKKKTVG